MRANALTWGILLLFSVGISLPVYSQTNSWIIPGDGAWQEASNWSLAQSPTNSQSLVITNDVSKTVMIDATTATSYTDSMTISELTLFAPDPSTNTLLLTNAGLIVPLKVLNACSVSHGGSLVVTNSAVTVQGALLRVDGALTLDSGLIAANAGMQIGFSSSGTVTLSVGTLATTSLQGTTNATVNLFGGVLQTGGTSLGNPLTVGDGSGPATLQLTGGTHSFGSVLTISSNVQLTGCGTVTSPVLNNGAILSGCPGGTLTFSSIVTNNASITASNGAVLTFYGTVVNNGTIDASMGNALFFSNIVNNGTIVLPSLPAPPSALVANILYPDLSHIYLSWQENADNETGYVVDRNTNGVGFVQLATLPANATNDTDGAFEFGSSVTPSALFLYRVYATNSVGNSGYSNIATAALYTVTNSWVNSTDGSWQDSANWSLAQPPAIPNVILVTNDLSKTVTLDSTTSGSFSNTMTVTDVILSAPNGSTNVFRVSDTGDNPPLEILHSLVLSNGGLLYVTNSALCLNTLADGAFIADGTVVLDANSSLADGTNIVIPGAFKSLVAPLAMYSGYNSNANASLWLTGGQLTLTHAIASAIGVNGAAQMVISNGQLQTSNFTFVGSGSGSQGGVTVAGGNYVSLFNGRLVLGGDTGAAGVVSISSGNLTITNSFLTLIGGNGSGQLNLSGGKAILGPIVLGGNPGSQGTLTVSDGTNVVEGAIVIASSPGTTGTVWVTGGQLLQTNLYAVSTTNFWTTCVGSWGVGTFVMSNGTWLGGRMIVGAESNAHGTVTLNGGTASLWSNLVVGNCSKGAVGTVTVAGGNLYVTNAVHKAFIDVRNGQLNLNGGLLQMDRLVMTNACGLFVRGGGTLIVGSLLLDPNLSAIADGIPNGWKQQHGLDPLDPTVANADPDGDGLSNLQEYLAGTDPTNSASTFRIISILPEGNDVLISWSVVTNETYVVQVATNTVDGSYTNAFTDLATVAVPLSPLITQTNYLDSGAVTNGTSRFYRIRLEP